MSDKHLVILGSASQVPTRTRNHNGYFLRWKERCFLIDPGEGTQRQMLFAGVTPTCITAIFISHFHGDHCLGLPGVIQRMSLYGVDHPVRLYYPASGEAYIRSLLGCSVFQNRLNLVFVPVESNGVICESDDMYIEACNLEHSIDTIGFRFVEKDKLKFVKELLEKKGLRGKIVGELQRVGRIRIGSEVIELEEVTRRVRGKVFSYVLDTAPCDGAVRLARNASLLLCESTYMSSDSHLARERGHMTSRDAATLALNASVSKLVLTHFSPRYSDVAPMLEEARSLFSETYLAGDMDVYPI